MDKVLFKFRWTLAALALWAIVFFIYASSLTTGFFADDYNFLEPAARFTLGEYLIHYFDPRAQVLWYRPLQGIQILIEYAAFGANAFGYHVVQILIHWVNGVLVFALVRRVSLNGFVAILSTLFYISFPVYALAVNWINITDPLMTVFYLLGVWFWLNYLDRGLMRDDVLTLVLFVVALLFKQMALTLPLILLLLDLLWYRDGLDLAKPSSLIRTARALGTRYAPFAAVALVFFAIQYFTRSTHTFAGVFGYSIGWHILSILTQYLSLLFFPWGYYPPTDTQITDQFASFIPLATVVWMAVAVASYLVATLRTHSRALIFLGAAAFITLLPVLPFPFIELRYLYLPAIFSGIGLALLVERACRELNRPVALAIAAAIALALLIIGDASAVANANAEIREIARQRRVPFRDISAAHRTFPDDTYLYFIDPVSPLPELKGLFALRYGRGVSVGGSDQSDSDFWRDHRNAFVYYFDDTGKPHEVSVEPHAFAQPAALLPANFFGAIALERVDIAQSKAKRGEVFIALLSWRATATVELDYTVFVHLSYRNGKTVAAYDSSPRKGKLPTREWRVGMRVTDPIVLPIPADAPAGDGYALQIGLYRLDTNERLIILNSSGAPAGDAVTIKGLSVE